MSSPLEQQKRRGRLIRYAPLILWIGVIFVLSSNAGSASNTSMIIRPLVLLLFPNISEDGLQTVHFFVRKTAHVTEYGILGLLALRAFKGSAIGFVRNWRYIFAVLLAMLVAVCDEYNQSFLASRTGKPEDALLDAAGATVFLVICYRLGRIFSR